MKFNTNTINVIRLIQLGLVNDIYNGALEMMRQTQYTLGLLFVVLSLSINAASVSIKLNGPWQKVLVSVSDLDRKAEFFLKVADYEILHRGRVDIQQLVQWNLPSDVLAESLLLAKPDTSAGFVRLIKFIGIEQQTICGTARVWNTGNFFSLMIRDKDIDSRLQEALKLGWLAESDPVKFDFDNIKIKNIVLKCQDGLNAAIYERLSPALQK